MRTLLLVFAAMLCGSQPAIAGEPTLRFIGQQNVPTGMIVDGTVVGGLSGIDYDPASGRYVAISDDRSRHGPARFYDIRLSLTAGHFAGVRFDGAHMLRQADRTYFPKGGIDAESIRFAGGDLLYASEGNARAGVAPSIGQISGDGGYLRTFAVPAHYLPGRKLGIRHNRAFESLTLSADGARILAATEDTLIQDGDASGPGGGLSRILLLDRASGAPVAEHVYEIEPGGAGLSELLALEGDRYLALERRLSPSGGADTAKIFLTDLANASDVLGRPMLKGPRYRPVEKTLLLDLGALGIPLGNIEGMTFGETLANGSGTLILVSDNDFARAQATQFLAFEIIPADTGAPIVIAQNGTRAVTR
jgi:hypothetical protein